MASNDYSQATKQQYTYSFSGADAKTLCFFPQRPDLIRPLDTVHTISISVHEGKSQVRSLGYRGMKGMTRSVRTIAGSIILTVVNDHPLRALMDQYIKIVGENGRPPFGWSMDQDETGVGSAVNQFDFNNRLASLMPPFNLLLEFVAESAPATLDMTRNEPTRGSKREKNDPQQGPSGKNIGGIHTFPGAAVMLQGIEIIDEGFIVSVNDMVTEITCSYIARDFKPISMNQFHDGISAAAQLVQDQAAVWAMMERCFPRTQVALPRSSIDKTGDFSAGGSPTEWEDEFATLFVGDGEGATGPGLEDL